MLANQLRHLAVHGHFTSVIDGLKFDLLRQRFEVEDSEEDVRRLRCLADHTNQDFSWPGRLNAEIDRVLNTENRTRHMHAMLGTQHLATDSAGGSCGQQHLDFQGYHTLRFAVSERTVGHNRVRDCTWRTVAHGGPWHSG